MKKWNRVRKEIGVLFSGWSLLFQLIILFAANFLFFLFVSKSIFFSIITGFIGMTFFFYAFIFKNRKLRVYQENLSDLMKYVTNVSFFLNTGNNVLYSLQSTLDTVSSNEVRIDIQKTIDILEKDAVLDTNHFKKYDFMSLNQFHHNLAIKDEQGGENEDLFSQIQQNMLFELKKRDELYRKRNSFALNVYVLLGMVSGMMVILRLLVPELWDTFLSVTLGSFSILFITFVLILINLGMVQKHKVDISVRI